MSGRVENKIALVTGGGSGLGRAAVQALVREGAQVLVADIREDAARETVGLVAANRASAFQMDVTAAATVENIVAETIVRYGRLDCAFNNAGIPSRVGTATIDYEEEDWDWVIAVDLKGVWLCMKYEIRQMLKQGSGAVINTGSIAGLVGLVGSSPYVAGKHGVVGLTKTAALEYAQQNVRFNAVCPGVFETPLVERVIAERPEREKLYLDAQPIGRLGRPEELAEAVV